MLSATGTGLLLNAVSGAYPVPKAQQQIFGMTAESAVPDSTALQGYSITASLLDLSAADENGQTMFDVVGAYYGSDPGSLALLGAYATAKTALGVTLEFG